MKSHWIEYKSRKIFVFDFTNFDTDHVAAQAEAEEVKKELAKSPAHSVRAITHVTGTVATTRNIQVLQSLLPVTNQYVMKRAVVGVTGVRKQFVALLNRLTGRAQFIIFDTMEEALEYLIKE